MSETNKRLLDNEAIKLNNLDDAASPKLAQRNTNQPDGLDEDYRAIATLLAELDQQSATLSGKMDRILDTVPSHDGLAVLWREQAEVLKNSAKRQSDDAAATLDNTPGKKCKPQKSIIDEEISQGPKDSVLFL